MLGFNGGLLGKRRVPSAGAAPGLWFPNEQSVAKRDAIWPLTGGYRYWRFVNFADTYLNNDTFDLTEVEFYGDNDVKNTVSTATASFSWTLGTTSVIIDGTKTDGNRAYKYLWSAFRSTATLTFDFGQSTPFNKIEIFSLYAQPRFPASFDLQFSTDGTNYSSHGTVTVGTTFTYLGGNVYTSGRVAI